jgi:RNA polymerase sigma-70 factor (ECF subfamily)
VVGVIADHQVSEEVRLALEILTPEQRDVLSLRIVGGLSIDQVAEVLNRGVKKIKVVQRRGMARVRSQLPAETVLA